MRRTSDGRRSNGRPTDVSQMRSFCFVEDLIEGMLRSVDGNHSYNVAAVAGAVDVAAVAVAELVLVP